MGKKREYENLMRQMQAMFTQAQAPSPYETQYGQEWSQLGDWLNKKDYRNLPAGAVVDLLPAAEYQRMRKMVQGNDAGQQTARGANTNALQSQQREMSSNQFLQDWGGAYEQKVGELANRRDALGNMLQGNYTNRQNIGIQGAQAQLQAFNNKPKSMWASLLPSLIGGGANIAASFA